MSTIYVITNYEFNHGAMRPGNPLNKSLLEKTRNYAFYLIDKKVPKLLQNHNVILEHELDPVLHAAGGKHLAEWSFLLAEERYEFCQYPFFMISSRFYEKNRCLTKNLNQEWGNLFSNFQEYGWGYLPSYDRPLRWIDLSWKRAIEKRAWEYTFFPFTAETYRLIADLFHVQIPEDYRYTADFFCNYIGFKNRQQLLSYVHFYKPLINFFFNQDFSLKQDLSKYVRPMGIHRNEKSFTFFLELLSHLFFFCKKEKYFALHYDGYYSVDEACKEMSVIQSAPLSINKKIHLLINGGLAKLNSNPVYFQLKKNIKSVMKG